MARRCPPGDISMATFRVLSPTAFVARPVDDASKATAARHRFFTNASTADHRDEMEYGGMPAEEGYTEALEAATSPRPTVLVVEDEPNIRELVCLHLGLENYECVQSGDGEGALKLARSQHFDLVILDVMLPGL